MGQRTSDLIDLIHDDRDLRICLAAYFTDTRPRIGIDVHAERNASSGFW